MIELLLILVVIGIGFIALGLYLSRHLQSLRGEREVLQVDFAQKQHTIEQLVLTIKDELAARGKEIRELEQDRSEKFSALRQTLDHHRQLTEQLQTTTQQLTSILSNNQLRGNWGERILDDLLRANGLVEGVHYARQQAFGTGLRPDFTLLLPDQRIVPIDVKFPYAEIQKMAAASSSAAKAEHVKQFASDIRQKIKKVAEYIQPDAHTLDYAILFVPNEMVFSFLNQTYPELIDDALAQHVLLVSPFTVLIVARTILESYRSFMIEDKVREILVLLGEFRQEWGRFSTEFQKFGRSIETLRSGYETLTTTRTTQMERKVHKIEAYQFGTSAAKAIDQRPVRIIESHLDEDVDQKTPSREQ